jgi:DNA polymerase I-like protein with 3'-5' exonuclease and polymerase domains
MKIKSTYAEGWKKQARDDGTGQYRVRPTFLVHGTSTGRLSSTGPNAQNMPREKKVRKIVALMEE